MARTLTKLLTQTQNQYFSYLLIIVYNIHPSWQYKTVKVQDLRQESAIVYARARMSSDQDGGRFRQNEIGLRNA
jgi:hypothetical protein